MNPVDILILLAVAAAVFFALRSLYRRRRSGGCSCGCGGSSCEGCLQKQAGGCASCAECKGKKP